MDLYKFAAALFCTASCLLASRPAEAQTELPIFDLVAKAELKGGRYHLVGTFCIEHKEDYVFSQNLAPKFFFSHANPRPGNRVSRDWEPLAYQLSSDPATNSEMRVIVASDPTTTTATPAIVQFDLTTNSDQDQWIRQHVKEVEDPTTGAKQKILASGALAVIMGPARASKDFGSRNEWSFVICAFGGPEGPGQDTNNVLPVGIVPTKFPRSGIAIGSDDATVRLNAPFVNWTPHRHPNSTPQSFGFTPYPQIEPDNWLAQDWTHLNSRPGYHLRSTHGNREFRVTYQDYYRYLMIYSPDICDIGGARYFQIGGVIRDVTRP